MLIKKSSVLLSLLVLLFAACDDAGTETVVDAGTETVVDAGTETVVDASPDTVVDASPDTVVDDDAEAEISVEDTTDDDSDGQVTPGTCVGEAFYCTACGGDASWSAECVDSEWQCTDGVPESECTPCPCCNFAGQAVSGDTGCDHPYFCAAWDRSTQWCQAQPGHPTTVEGTTVAYGAEICAGTSSWFSGTTTLEIAGAAFTITWSDSTETVSGTLVYDAATGALALTVDGTPPSGFDGEGTLYGGTGDKTPIIVDMALGAPTGELTACGYTMGAPPVGY